MDPITATALIGGASSVLGKIFGPSGGGGPQVSSATSIGGTIAAPFNVGGGIGGAGQIGALAGFFPILLLGAVAWYVLKK